MADINITVTPPDTITVTGTGTSSASVTVTESEAIAVTVLPDTGPQGPQGEQGEQGPVGPGIPNGGTEGQVLTKKSSTNLDADWEEPQAGTPADTVVDHGALTGLADDDHTQYLIESRADTWLSGKDTDNIAEGDNLYFTNERVASAAGAMATNSIIYNATAETIMLDGDELAPSNDKYYGTNSSGTKGFFVLPASPEPGASKAFAVAMAIALG